MRFDGHDVVAISGTPHGTLVDWLQAGLFTPVEVNCRFEFVFADVFVATVCWALVERGIEDIERLKLVANAIRETPVEALEDSVLAVGRKRVKIVSMPFAKRCESQGRRILFIALWRNFVRLRDELLEQQRTLGRY